MKITIDIPDKEIQQEVFTLLTRRIADQIFSERGNYDRGLYKRVMKEALSGVFKERADEIIDRCIPWASEYIGKKGVKKFVDGLGKEIAR